MPPFSRRPPASPASGACWRACPIGTLIAVLPPAPQRLERANLSVFSAYSIDPSVLDREGSWSATPRAAYARPWRALATAFAAMGDAEGAARNRRRGETLEPWVGPK